MSAEYDITIIGGGISGLSAAWYVQQLANANQHPLTYTVLEQGDRWGGKIRSERVEGFGQEPFIVEGGPDSFLTQKPCALCLARELGLQDQLLGTNASARQVYVLNHGKLVPLPAGVMMIVPTRFMPFALSPLISPLGKLRMGLDLFIPPLAHDEDETLAAFVRRRLGAEALDKIAEPLMAGIYNAESEKQSLLATFSRFRDLETKHGSLIGGMLASHRKSHSPSQNSHGCNGTAPSANEPPISAFMSLRSGTEALIHELVCNLHGDLHLNTAVQHLAQIGKRYVLTLNNGDCITSRAVIITTPAYVAASLLRDVAPDAAQHLDAIRYVSTGTISLAFRREDVPHSLKGFGIVIPRSERRPINAITWSSTKFKYRAPEGYVLLRVFFGGSRNPAMMDVDDGALLDTVRSELSALLGIQAEPVLHRIFRWQRANPQYDLGHLDRVAAVEAALPTHVYVSGSPYRGVGMPDCIGQSQQVARRAVERLR